jgi:protein TonB
VYAQEKCEYNPITLVEQMPIFKSGDSANFLLWIYQNLKYPQTAINDSVSGEVIARFKIDSLGTLNDIEIIRSARRDLDSEAMSVLESSPKWTPAKQGGKNIGVYYAIPILFDIKDQSFIKKIDSFTNHHTRTKRKKHSR